MFERMRGEKKSLLTDAVSDSEKQAYMRKAQAWAAFASTPGPLLVAGMKAVMKYADETIEDDKELRKVKADIMKSIHEIDMADYNESAGLADKASKRRETAFGHAMQANDRLAQVQGQRSQTVAGMAKEALQSGTQSKRQREENISREKVARINASVKGEGGDEKSTQRQTEKARAELTKFDNSEKGKALAQAESMLSTPGLKGDARTKFEKDRDRLKAERDALTREVMRSYPSARLEDPNAKPAPAYSAEDIAFTAKKHNVSEEEVKKRLGIK